MSGKRKKFDIRSKYLLIFMGFQGYFSSLNKACHILYGKLNVNTTVIRFGFFVLMAYQPL